MTTETQLGHDDPRLAEAIREKGLPAGLYHTGGGVYVLEVALDGSTGAEGFHTNATGVVLWITREQEWILGLYDYSREDDEGVMLSPITLSVSETNDPEALATWVAGLVERLRNITSANRALVLKSETEEGGGPLFLADPTTYERMESVGEPGRTWFTREQAVAVAKAFRVQLRSE